MDELVKHCMRELAYEGELGCGVDELRNFIVNFTNQKGATAQLLDAHYFDFVWRTLSRYPGIHVGTVPDGAVDVIIAPQNATKRLLLKEEKASKRDSPADEDAYGEEDTGSSLSLIPAASTKTLDELVKAHSDHLRIAVSADIVSLTITGAHIRPTKVTPMVYTCLQFICRGREKGLTVIEIGAKSGYDQKTCFYLVKVLVELNLVAKIKTLEFVTHVVVHRHFLEQNPAWQQLAQNPESEVGISEDLPKEDPSASIPTTTSQEPPIGVLQSTQLDRMLVDLPPQGMAFVDPALLEDSSPVLSMQQQDQAPMPMMPIHSLPVPLNSTIEHLIHESMVRRGVDGSTMNQLRDDVGQLDKRVMEHLMNKAERSLPPEHLRDLATCDVMETFGRERRHKYFTLAAYRELSGGENMRAQDTRYQSISTSSAGGFLSDHLSKDLFYERQEELETYLGSFNKGDKGTKKLGRPRKYPLPVVDPNAPPKKRGRPRKYPRPEDEETSANADANVEKPPPKKRGRPRKHPVEEVEDRNEKAAEDSGNVEETVQPEAPPPPEPPKRKRGRPRKHPLPDEEASPVQEGLAEHTPEGDGGSNEPPIPSTIPAKRPRGRPRKTGEMAPDQGDAVAEDLPNGVHNDTPGDGNTEDTGPRRSKRRRIEVRRADEVVSTSVAPKLVAIATSEASSANQPEPIEETQARDTSPGPTAYSQTNAGIVPLTSQVMDQSNDSGLRTPVENEMIIDPKLQSMSIGRLASSSTPTSQENTPSKTLARHVNLSAFRRKEELMRIIEGLGGIMDVTPRNLREAHAKLLEEMIKSGEATSAPVGLKGDRKTLDKALTQLEEDGRIKTLVTTLPDRFGLFRRTKIAYKSGTTSEDLSEFLKKMGEEEQSAESFETQAPSLPQDRESLVYIYQDNEMRKREVLDPNNCDNFEEASSIRNSVLKDRQAVAQLYGASLGRIARARQLHMHAIRELSNTNPSQWILPGSSSHRILNVAFFWNELTLKEFCAVVPVLQNDDDLDAAFFDDKALALPVKQVSQRLRSLLQIGLSRSRERLRTVLDLLAGLGLATPLKAKDDLPQNSVDPDPHSLVPLDGTEKTSLATYWLFEEVSALWTFADQDPAPILYDVVSVRTAEDAATYWVKLRELALGLPAHPLTDGPLQIEQGRARPLSAEAAFALPYSSRWKGSFTFAKNQTDELYNHARPSHLGDPASLSYDSKVSWLAWSVAAPKAAVETFLERCTHLNDRKKQRQNKSTEDAKKRLAEKSRQAKEKLQEKWVQLVGSVHSGPLEESSAHRLDALKEEYLTKGSFAQDARWKKGIRKAIYGDNAFQIAALRRPGPAAQVQAVQPSGGSTIRKSVRDLVIQLAGQQGSTTPRRLKSTKKKKKKEDEENADPEEAPRKQRFVWNRELDELARDAAAIVRARCRSLPRMDWAAVEQVFPNVPRNSVRQRVLRLSEEPAAATYIRRLEDAWYDLWVKHRGTDVLPDPNPDTASEFDMIHHVQFLRDHIDKTALYIGVGAGSREVVTLPRDVSHFAQRCSFASKQIDGSPWEPLWAWGADETREKTLTRTPFLSTEQNMSEPEPLLKDYLMTQTVLKMVLATPDSVYDEHIAADVLRQCGQKQITKVSENLLEAGILSKTQYDSAKKRPGRKLRMSDANHQALEGPLSSTLFSEAKNLDQDLATLFREWTPLATAGSTAGLLHLISNNSVQFRIDTSRTSKARDEIDLNSKKIDDDRLEADLEVALRVPTDEIMRDLEPDEGIHGNQDDSGIAHADSAGSNDGHIHDGASSFCSLSSDGVINCTQCLSNTLDTVPEDLQETVGQLYQALEQAGQDGLSKESLSEMRSYTHITSPILKALVESRPPLAYWAGHESSALVPALHIKKWTVTLSDRLVLPRRWIDMLGNIMQDTWEAACRAVVGNVAMRPGISEADLRNRLCHVYGACDMNEVVDHLVETTVLRRVVPLLDLSYPVELAPAHLSFLLIGPGGPWSL